MAFQYTTDDLVASIRVRGRVPTSQTTFTDARIRKLCDEEIGLGLLPQILAVRENYYVRDHEYNITSGQSEYRIPSRAVGVKLKGVFYVDPSGNECPIPQIPFEERGFYQSGNQSMPVFYIKANSVVLVPEPTSTSGTLKLSYFIRPNSLVAVSAAGEITAIDTALNTVTVSTIPSTFSVGDEMDFIKHDGGFECIAINQSITAINSTTISFASLPSGLEIGDYVSLAGETPIPQIPAELHPVLALRVVVSVLESLGFVNEMKAAQAKLQEAEKATDVLIAPRADSNAKKISARGSILRQRNQIW
jgi:hypothetical protein